MGLTADEAFDLACRFRELAKQVGDTRIDKWDDLKPAQRQELEDQEWDLLGQAMSMRTKAVGLALDESGPSLAKIIRTTDDARKAIKALSDVGKAIDIAATAVTLAAAVLSKDPPAIAKNAKALYDEVQEATA